MSLPRHTVYCSHSTCPQPGVESQETPGEKLAQLKAEIFGSAAPLPVLAGSDGAII